MCVQNLAQMRKCAETLNEISTGNWASSASNMEAGARAITDSAVLQAGSTRSIPATLIGNSKLIASYANREFNRFKRQQDVEKDLRIEQTEAGATGTKQDGDPLADLRATVRLFLDVNVRISSHVV